MRPDSVFAVKVVEHSRPILALITVILCLSLWAGSGLANLREDDAPFQAADPELLRGFHRSGRIREAVVFWCRDCNLQHSNIFKTELSALETFLRMHYAEGSCSDLEWSSLDSPSAGASAKSYMSEDGTTTLVDVTVGRADCLPALRAHLAKRSTAAAAHDIHFSLAGPYAITQASERAENADVNKHMFIAAPIMLLAVSVITGSVLRATTPLLCMWAAVITSRACTVLVKWCWHDFNVSFIHLYQTTVCFFLMALCLDYAIFFWTRFSEEVAKPNVPYRGFEASLIRALCRSGEVIVLSSVILIIGYGCTLFFPTLNSSGWLALYVQVTFGVGLSGLYSVTLTPALASVFQASFDEGDGMLAKVQTWCSVCSGPHHLWRSWAKRITVFPWMFLVPLVAYVCMSPFLLCLSRFEPNFDKMELMVRHDTIEYEAYVQFSAHFNVGRAMPVEWILQAFELEPLKDTLVSVSSSLNVTSSIVEPDNTSGVLVGKKPLIQRWPSLSSTLNITTVHNSVLDNVSTVLVGARPCKRDTGSTGTLDDDSPALVSATDELTDCTEVDDDDVSMLQIASHFSALAPRGTQKGGQTHQTASGPLIASTALGVPLNDDSHFSLSSQLPLEDSVTLSAGFGLAVCDLAESIIKHTRGHEFEISSENVASVWWSEQSEGGHGCVSGARMAAAMATFKTTAMEEARRGVYDSISADGSRQLLSIFPPFHPTGIAAVHLSELFREKLETDARRVFEHEGRRYEFRAKHTSAVSVQVEEDRRLSAVAPWLFGTAGACTAVTVGLLFRSAVVPAKLVLTVMVPILATYGITVAVFQFDMWSLPSKGLGPAHGVGYNTMYLSVGCLFGLAMDYDIFLFARVYEHRLAGHDNLSAVQRATSETGPVITTAGTLMALSFFFISLSGVAIVRMIGFTYLVGACLDTWVVRPCIAPAFLCAFGNINYWPGVVPEPPTKYEW